jgi:hypothetical protein
MRHKRGGFFHLRDRTPISGHNFVLNLKGVDARSLQKKNRRIFLLKKVLRSRCKIPPKKQRGGFIY